MYINTTTLQRVSEYEIRQAFPNTSFAMPFQPPEGYAVLFNSPTPIFNANTQGYREVAPKQLDGTWYQTFEIYDLPAEAVAALQTQQAQSVRDTRNYLLTQSDWTQTLDAPVDKAAWATYRQQLRDISTQPDFPETINWPQPP